MSGVKLKEYANQAKPFELIQSAVSDLFIFESFTADDLNQLLILNHGNKTMFEPVLDVKPELVIGQLLNTYLDTWKLLPTIKDNVKLGADSYGKKTIVTDSKGNKDSENKVSAFNSDQLITDGGESVNDGRLTNQSITDDKFSLNAVFNNLTYLEKTGIINTVLHDIAKFYCVSIYQ